MSAFALYVFGFIVFVAGVLYAEHLLHVPQTWVLVSGLVMVGLGVMTAVSHTKRRDPPSEAPRRRKRSLTPPRLTCHSRASGNRRCPHPSTSSG